MNDPSVDSSIDPPFSPETGVATEMPPTPEQMKEKYVKYGQKRQ
jgi:hypothetical protein